METGFFKWLWRFNAIAIALVVLLVVGIVGLEIIRDISRSASRSGAANTLAVSDTEADLPEGSVRRYFSSPYKGTDDGIYALPLYVEQLPPNRGVSYNTKSSGNLVNIRIVQTDSRTDRWLFAQGKRLIQNTTQLTLQRQGYSDLNLGHQLSVIEVDTNGDGQLSPKDAKTLYLTDTRWSEPVKLADGVRLLLSTTAVSPTTLDLIYTTDTATHIVRVALQTGAIISEQVITPQD